MFKPTTGTVTLAGQAPSSACIILENYSLPEIMSVKPDLLVPWFVVGCPAKVTVPVAGVFLFVIALSLLSFYMYNEHVNI